MKAKYIRGLVDVIEVSDRSEIATANRQPEIDRLFTSKRPLLDNLLLSNVIGTLS